MTALKARLAARIAATGPLSVADYMAACLFDPQDGYYTTREPFGAGGDFTTAPEISQMFGELVGVWVVGAWTALGRPLPFRLTEIGPGRGTLMKDMLRVIGRLAPDLAARLDAVLVEASPRLVEVQRATLAASPAQVRWLGEPDETPETPGIVVANELFDAIPCRQFVKTPRGWRERMVALDGAGDPAFVAGAGGIDAALLPAGADAAPMGAIFEVSPAREAMMERIADALRHRPGMALLIDYGHGESGFGDTLQAVRSHRFADPLAEPGEADLTSHVDFAPLMRVAERAGLAAALVTQGEFLLGMGLLERAGTLGAAADAEVRERLASEVERLAGSQQMGNLFKALIVHPKNVLAPAMGASD